MFWKVRVKVRTYYKGKTPYKVATITLPREVREVLEKNGIDYVYIATKPMEGLARSKKNDKYVWALRKLAKFFEYILLEGAQKIAYEIIATGANKKGLEFDELSKVIQSAMIRMIEDYFKEDYEKMEKILNEVTSNV